MKHHVKNLFLDWHENNISADDRSRIEQHLGQCIGCRTFYEKMSGVFDDRSLLAMKEIQVDPYLPSRIISLAEDLNRRPRPHLQPIVRWTVAVAGVSIAIILGTYIGQGLSGSGQTTQETDDITGYYDVIAQHGAIDQWESGSESIQGTQQ